MGMTEYSLELANSTTRLKCSCCSAGMTSVCGFISKGERPYSVYYALIHNTRKDIFVRLSISIGDWWRHDSFENRYALCLDVTASGKDKGKNKDWHMTVLDAMHSPQQNFAKFGQWLGTKTGRRNPLIGDLMEVADFIVTHDPAVLTYLTGHRPDYTGRDVQQITKN
jgi:hypothetical protein